MGLGPGRLVFTALLWLTVAAASGKAGDFIEATEIFIRIPESF